MILTVDNTKTIVKEANECNPTIFAVFISGTLREMSSTEVYWNIGFIIPSFFINIICLVIISKSRIFHSNLQLIIWWTVFLWFELAAGKIITIIYQKMFLNLGGVLITNNSLILLAWSACIHYHYIFSALIAPFIGILERAFATKYILDYEKKSRRWIFLVLLSIQNIFAGILTLFTLFNSLKYLEAAVIGLIISALSFITFMYLHTLNKNKLRVVERYNQDLTFNLSCRYQLRENIRTFNLIRRFFFMSVCIIMLMIVLKTVPMVLDAYDNTKLWFRVSTDLFIQSSPILIFLMISGIEGYRKTICHIFGVQSYRIEPIEMLSKAEKTDVYFGQLLKTLNTKK